MGGKVLSKLAEVFRGRYTLLCLEECSAGTSWVDLVCNICGVQGLVFLDDLSILESVVLKSPTTNM